MAQLNTDLETIKTARDNMKTALEGQGQTVTKDIRTYAQAIANISGGSGDVKLFDTIEHMQQDQSAQEGDLAVVYRNELEGITEDSEFSSCIFPNTVVLDEAFTGNVSERFRQVDDGYFDGIINVSSTAVIFQGYGESSEIRVEYTSQNGITYTRTDGGEELQEFGTTIKWESMGGPFHSIIGNFMKIGGKYFDGLYEYVSGIHSYRLGQIKYVTIKDNKAIIDDTHNLLIFDKNIIVNLIDKCVEYVKNIENISIAGGDCATILIDEDNHLIVAYSEMDDKYMRRLRFVYDSSTSKFRCFQSEDSGTISFVEYIFDIETSEYINKIEHTFEGTLNNLGITNVFDNYYAIGYYTDRNKLQNNTVWFNENGDYNRYGNIYEYKSNKYILADNQLDATLDYVYEKTFYGKNGVENGTLTTNVSNSFTDVNTEVYAQIQKQYDNMQPIILTDQDKSIDKNIYYIPVRSDGVVLIDTSGVTDMSSMFVSCINLRTIPQLDTSNATNMYFMFRYCSSLNTVALLNTSNVINMEGMFRECTGLETVPQFNTSSVTNMSFMFNNCSSLTSVPLLNTSSVTAMTYMFNNCLLLSDISLNNILAMCTNATKISSNKTLKHIGLTQEQAQICTTLSNYQAFVNAGWTTGY